MHEVLGLLEKNHILVTIVPANKTKQYQPLDLTVNRYAKKILAKHLVEWYTTQTFKQLEDGEALDNNDVKLWLSVLKCLHAEWLMTLYNELTSPESRKIINKGRRTSGITHAIKFGSSKLPLLRLKVTSHVLS